MNLPEERIATFWSRVTKTDGCWLWTGTISRKGYGHFRTDGAKGPRIGAHRIAYELLVGTIPDGLVLDHLCRIRHCVNPQHLEPVTNGENVLRGEGITARQARNTHCPRGHLFGPRDERLGQRVCRECVNIRKRERRAGKRRVVVGENRSQL